MIGSFSWQAEFPHIKAPARCGSEGEMLSRNGCERLSGDLCAVFIRKTKDAKKESVAETLETRRARAVCAAERHRGDDTHARTRSRVVCLSDHALVCLVDQFLYVVKG